MASDEIVWSVINQQFCSYKLRTTKDQNFCRNEYNVTGFCSRQSCPLANSRYATVRANPETGALYLFVKTIERSHMPSKWWQRIKLSGNYSKALEQIDAQLIYWPKFLVHKCKQRLTRLTQVAIRTRKLEKEEERLGEKVVTRLAPKVRRREDARERKAEAAAKVERAIERELIDRLKSGAYGDKPLNVEESVWKKVLRGLEREGQGTRDTDLDQGIEEEEWEVEQEEEAEGAVEYVSDIEGESDEDDDEVNDIDDLEDWADRDTDEEDGDEEGSEDSASDNDSDERLRAALNNLKRKRAKSPPTKNGGKNGRRSGRKGPRMEIEYETEPLARERVLA